MAGLVRQDPQQMQGAGMAGLPLQDRAVAPLGAGEVAGTVARQRPVERGVRPILPAGQAEASLTRSCTRRSPSGQGPKPASVLMWPTSPESMKSAPQPAAKAQARMAVQ